ncbi:DUF4440 domain-containing protein [Seongchinamella sediminis]|uniref:DUF4440 domain-containing protein n=1 Tax=Seongchinamella sediminis TaxID=2283635 RepID=A0A3L7DX44_9GAMM|nr:DUF4440 domain-containing protein [Seongchinamella sediminis]RLQ21139.1 DUF4440 domain-containing protein [Seongchinamella sediminis]
MTLDTKDKASIVNVLEELKKTWNSGDMDGFLAQFCHGPETSVAAGGDAKAGWPIIEEMFRNAYPVDQMGTFGADIEHVQPLAADTVLAVGSWDHWFPNEEVVGGKFTHIYKRDEGGKWKVLHEHTSRRSGA